MKNILLLFAKLNPAVRYVQGMNEVLSPIYYVFSTDTDKENAVSTFWENCLLCYLHQPLLHTFYPYFFT